MADKKAQESLDPEVKIQSAIGNTENFIMRNGRKLLIALIVVFVIVGGFYGYKYFVAGPRAEKAASMMFMAEQHFVADSFHLALNGDGNFDGFLKVIDKYGSTPQGNLAQHYAGICYLQLGQYEEALAHPMIAGLVIGTRPDTVNDEVLDYLELLAREYYVCVEYGVESVNDEVLQRVNRGHGFAASERAIRGTAGRGIAIGAHLIFGLPGESRESMLEGAVRLCELPIQVLKLHQLQIVKDTRMAEEYAENPSAFQLYTQEEYLDFVVEVIERIRPDVYLERFVNQSPPEYLIAPKWGIKNFEFTAKLDKRLEELDTWQGRLKDKS